MKYSSLALLLLVALIVSFSCADSPKMESNHMAHSPIVGTWKMKSVHWITKDTTYSVKEAQPGMLIVTPESYSIMWTPTENPRIPFKNLSEPTDEELKAGFRSIVFNCGTHEYSDSTLTTTAQIAKVPGFENGQQFYRYELAGDKMELTMFDEIYPDGTRPTWFGTYETQFVLEKVD